MTPSPFKRKSKSPLKHPEGSIFKGDSRSGSEAKKDQVLRAIHNSGGRWMTANEVATKAGVTWTTAKICLSELFHEGYLQKGETDSGITCWKEND